MSPELLRAVKERMNLGRSDEEITNELKASGYTDEVIDSVLKAVRENEGGKTAEQNSTVNNEISSANSAAEVVLPGVLKLFKYGLTNALKRFDVVLFMLIAPIVLIMGLGFLMVPLMAFVGHSVGLMTLSIIILATVTVYVNILITLSAMKIAVTADQSRLSIGEALSWTNKNFWSLLWVSVLTLLATYGGTVLFIIPGLIVAGYIYFSQFVYINEGERGMRALMRSRDLVLGRWLAV